MGPSRVSEGYGLPGECAFSWVSSDFIKDFRDGGDVSEGQLTVRRKGVQTNHSLGFVHLIKWFTVEGLVKNTFRPFLIAFGHGCMPLRVTSSETNDESEELVAYTVKDVKLHTNVIPLTTFDYQFLGLNLL